VPKSTTLDGLKRQLPTLLHSKVFLGAQQENVNEDRPTAVLSASKIHPNDSSFWQYKVYADIRGVSLGEGALNDSG